MRMLLKANIPTPAGNAAIEAGTMGPTMQKAIAALKAEAAYFSLENGMRTAYIFFDLKDPSGMPAAGEELFMKLGAQISMTPAMTAEDLAKGLAQLG
ncbi:MAG TPA: hypothetical protein VEZ14_14155 [Dehalococcoidia bacterium]|nr:hypothetical protein [Dehalococcoidia bacterium]